MTIFTDKVENIIARTYVHASMIIINHVDDVSIATYIDT